MNHIKKPMLASPITDVNKLTFPLIASPKLDGIRCLVIKGRAVTRNLKPIPNTFIRKTIESWDITGLDGEIILPGMSFNEIQSLVMREEGEPNFTFVAFDYFVDLKEVYIDRIKRLEAILIRPHLEVLKTTFIGNIKELLEYEKFCLETLKVEGVMVRQPSGKYKFGRSSEKEQLLLKLKRFKDAEAIVIGFVEYMTNNNPSVVNKLGYKEKSSHKENLIPSGKLGKLLVHTLDTKVEFGIGSGFTDKERIEIWNKRENYLGGLVTYTFQEAGVKDKPRFPIFKGFRNIKDLD